MFSGQEISFLLSPCPRGMGTEYSEFKTVSLNDSRKNRNFVDLITLFMGHIRKQSLFYQSKEINFFRSNFFNTLLSVCYLSDCCIAVNEARPRPSWSLHSNREN